MYIPYLQFVLPFFLTNFIVIATIPTNGSIMVQTSYGTLQGFVHALDNKKFMDVFLGIPYAEPPIGELRFEVDETSIIGECQCQCQFTETVGTT